MNPPNTISAQEIARRGIGAVDEHLERGPVHVVLKDSPRYVVMSEAQYDEFRDSLHEAYIARVKASLADVEAGRVYRFDTVDEMMEAIKNYPDDEDDA